MRERHVILRTTVGATRDAFRGGVATAAMADAAGAGLAVDVDEIEPHQVSALTRNADVLCVAPAIPLKLIAPVATPADAGAAAVANGMTWGVHAVGADTSPFSGDGIVVAVLDTGIDAGHAAFGGVKIVQEDFTGEGNGDSHGHGTHCAGTIFGKAVDGVRIGIAPGIKRALIGKVLGAQGGSSDQIIRAIQWAVDNGAHVISMSLGIDFPGLVAELQRRGLPPELATSRALEGYRANVLLFERMASLVSARGAMTQATVIVAAAGNESQRDKNPDFEIAVSPPAVAEGIISVAALARDPGGLSVAPFSNTSANVAGPGVAVVSAKMGGGLATMSGTSMATPHVAGVLALWAEKIKAVGVLNTLQLTGKLVGTASTSGMKAGFDPVDVGAGMVRAPQD